MSLIANANLMNLNQEGQKIFRLLYQKGPLTKNVIMDATHIKLTKLNRLMEPLEKAKLIVESDIGDSSGGRKPVLYDVNRRDYSIIGIDLSRTYLKVVLTNLKMNILGSEQLTMDETASPGTVVAQIGKAVENILNAAKLHRETVLGVGVGTVGPLDREKGIILNPLNFPAPNWANVPIQMLLERELGFPVSIDNGANTAALAEYLFGEGKNFANMAYIHCGVGIRTGVIAEGRIVRTIHDAEDAFGHMIIDVDGEPCSCGNFGCIECYSSLLAIADQYTKALKKGRIASIKKPIRKITYKDICAAAEAGEELAKEIITSAATVLGAGLANYINLMDPGLVIVSGPLIAHSNLFYEVSRDVALKKHYFKTAANISFCRGGSFGDNAIAVGAAVMVIENHLGLSAAGTI